MRMPFCVAYAHARRRLPRTVPGRPRDTTVGEAVQLCLDARSGASACRAGITPEGGHGVPPVEVDEHGDPAELGLGDRERVDRPRAGPWLEDPAEVPAPVVVHGARLTAGRSV